jgi:acetylglutamate kinase
VKPSKTTLISADDASHIVIKLGGEVIASPDLANLAMDIAALSRLTGVVIVHGGGPQASKMQERLGQKPVKIAGRRVTDADTLDVMKMVVAGKLNVDLASALLKVGANPVGLNGSSSRVIAAEKRPPTVYAGAGPDPVDLGLVGDVVGLDLKLISLLIDHGYIPVLACLGAGKDGQMFNINADTVANRAAVELKARGLVMISDVTGVLRDVNDKSSRIPALTVTEGKRLISEGIVKDGMIPKLEESFAAIAEGVKQIHIVGKLKPGELAREVESPGSVGTVLVP